MPIKWIDSHTHLDMVLETTPEWTLDNLLDVAGRNGVSHLVSVGTSIETSQRLRRFVPYPNIACSAGIHPREFFAKLDETAKIEIETLLLDPYFAAIGEIGLDFLDNDSLEERSAQIELLSFQLTIAKQCKKPIIFHCRNAFGPLFEIIDAHSLTNPLILHCFTGDETIAKEALKRRMFISFSGILTFKNAETIRQASMIVPDDALLLETDAPFLAPAPFRGKTNHPALLLHTGEALARQRRCSVETLATLTSSNALALFFKAAG